MVKLLLTLLYKLTCTLKGVCDCCDGGDELDTPRPIQCKVSCPSAADSSLWFVDKVSYKEYPLKRVKPTNAPSRTVQLVDPNVDRIVTKVDLEVDPIVATRASLPSSQSSQTNTFVIIFGFLVVLLVFMYATRQSVVDSHGPILATYRRSSSTVPSSVYCFGFTSSWITKTYFGCGRYLRYCFLKFRVFCICCRRRGSNWLDKSVAETV